MPKVDTTVRELVDMVGRGELRLPEMQRRYVWRATRVRDLIDSLYRGYPSGAVLVWETDQDAPTRDLDVAQATNAFVAHKLLLDGQQRVTSLRAVLYDEPIRVRGRKKPIDILFNLEHPEGAPVELTEVEDDSESPLLADEDGGPDEEDEDEADDLQQRLRKRTFVVASKALAAIPTWIRVSDVFNPKKSDWTLLKPLGLQPDNPLYEKYSQRLQKLRGIQQYQYVMHVLDRNLSYEEVAEIFVRVNSLGVKLRSSDLAMAQVTARWQNSLRLFEEFGEDLDNKSWFTLDTGLLVRTMVVFATGQSRFKTLDLSSVRYPPVSADLWIQHLRTHEREILTLGEGGVKERRLEDYVVRGLVDFDDVSYDEQADLLYDLAGQTVRHFLTYLSEDEARQVLQYHQHQLAAHIHAQMQTHYWEKVEGYEATVSHGFTALRASAYTAGASDGVQDYRTEPRDRTKIGQLVYGGFTRCLFRRQKFGSDTERRFAVILERDSLRWFKPAKGQFQIFYRLGSGLQQYVPDFVAETGGKLLMIETKARNEMATPEVAAKRTAAEEWCQHASAHAATYGGKLWRYALVPHDTVADNMTLDRLTGDLRL